MKARELLEAGGVLYGVKPDGEGKWGIATAQVGPKKTIVFGKFVSTNRYRDEDRAYSAAVKFVSRLEGKVS